MRRCAILLIFALHLLPIMLRGQSYTMSNGTITTCSGSFYDPGGPNSNYASDLDYTQTFVSANSGTCIQVVFNSFQLESSTYDYLRIFDGPDASSPIIGTYGGANSPGTVTSTSGSLTFLFHSDNSVSYEGWSSIISCVDCSQSPPIPPATSSSDPCEPGGIHPFCSEDNPYGVSYASGVGTATADSFFGNSSGTGIGCLGTIPRPAWYYMQISSPGDLLIHIQQFNSDGSAMDVDFACWGPFTAFNQEDFKERLCAGQYVFTDSDLSSHHPVDGNHSNGDTGGYPDGTMIDCSYNSSNEEWCYIPNAQLGQWYLLLLTNYNSSGSVGTISFNSVAAFSTANTNCNLIVPFHDNGPLCEGDTLVLTCNNPIAGATYNWWGPGGWTATTTVPTVSIPNVSPANSGQYFLWPTGSGVSADSTHINVTVSANLSVNVTAGYDTVCAPRSVSFTANGVDNPNVTYTWMPGNLSGRTISRYLTNTTSGQVDKTYTVTVSSGGCSATASYTVVTYPSPSASITIFPSSEICEGDTVVLHATAGYSYQWRESTNATILSVEDSLVVSPIATTSYRVITSNVWGCTKSATKTVTVHSQPENLLISGDTQVCIGNSVQLSVSHDGSGCDYLWSTGESSPVISVTPSESSDYTVTVTNSDGCSALANIHLRVNQSNMGDTTATVCYSFDWYEQTNLTTSGDYTRTVSNAAGCDSVVTLHLTVTGAPEFAITVMSDTICLGDSVMLWVNGANAPYIPGIQAPPVAVGDILCTDNSIVKSSAWPVAGKTAKGIVFYVDNTGSHGWAVHLQDQGTSVQWTPSGSYTDISTLTNYTNARDAIADLNGYINTQRIRAAGNATTYPAAYAVDFANGWYLPATGQLRILYSVMVTVNASLQIVGGTQFLMDSGWWYWSSTEYGSSYAWLVLSDGYVYTNLKNLSSRVRSVRAF